MAHTELFFLNRSCYGVVVLSVPGVERVIGTKTCANVVMCLLCTNVNDNLL